MFAAESELALTLGRSPSVREVARRLGEPEADVAEALAAEGCFTPTSLDRPVADGADTTIGDLLGDRDLGRAAVEARVMLAPVVRRLSERDRRILQLRFFDDRTQREIADEIGVTQTQVSRVLGRIIRSLRAELDGPRAESA
jgi:RNA polymerase sigma-B factor